MKDKPKRHQSKNTFKFQSFLKKIQSIKVSSRAFLLKKSKKDDESITEFYSTLQKCQELNLSKGFKDFQKDLGPDIQSLSQLLLQEERLVNIFKEHIASADVLVLPTVLECLVAFAVDIAEIFFENYFYSFFPILEAHLKTKCHETIENVFVCYVSLFTIGQKYIRTNIFKLYHEEKYSLLLSKSYPWYINELAAQSLGFLVRKLPNLKQFFLLAFEKLKKDESQTEGLGRLIFYTMKSDAANRLHSSSAKILSTILDVLQDDKIPIDPSREAIEYAFITLATYVTSSKNQATVEWKTFWREDSKLIWPIFWENVSVTVDQRTPEAAHYLTALFQIILKIVKFKHAMLVVDAEVIIEQSLEVVSKNMTDAISPIVCSIFSTLMLSSHHSFSHSFLKRFLDNLLSSEIDPNEIFSFIEEVESFSQFDGVILPMFLNYINTLFEKEVNVNIYKSIISAIAGIVSSKQTPLMASIDVDSWTKYPIDFSLIKRRTSTVPLISALDSALSEGLDEDLKNFEEILLVCVCIPHVFPMNFELYVPSLIWILHDARKKLLEDDGTNSDCKSESSDAEESVNDDMLLCLIGYIIETLYHILSADDFLTGIKDIDLISLLKTTKYKENVYLLKALHIVLKVSVDHQCNNLLNEETFNHIYSALISLLTSPKPLIRLLVARILSSFKHIHDSESNDSNSVVNIFSLMAETEMVPLTPFDYKERLRILSKLEYNNVKSKLPFGTNEKAPLLFLIGQLHINFKEIWAPMRSHIAGYAQHLKEDIFWSLWLPQLQEVSSFTYKELCGYTIEANHLEFENAVLSSLHSSSLYHPGYANLPTKMSYLHLRDQLWMTMSLFPSICERKNRDVISLFFNFLYKEYFPADVNVAPTQDISEHSLPNSVEDMECSIQEEAELPDEVDEAVESIPDKKIKKAPTASFCTQLSLFTKFHNPKVLHRTDELLEIYKEFLSHPYLPAQKMALEAIMTYNFKFLNPYKDSLFRILDDKSFKEEITLFNIDGEGDDETRALNHEHRKDFMPILLKILYGKMLSKTGTNSAGKSKTSVRKGVVIRFLAGASETELDSFLDLTFDVFLSHLDGTALDVVNRVQESVNPKEVVPLKRIHGAFRTLETIIIKLGSLLSDKRGFFLKVLLFILSTVVTLLSKKEQISKNYISLLKSLRQMSLQKIVLFFGTYKDYPWSPEEIDAVYVTGIWPSLELLPNEGIYSPTPMMQLFLCWAEFPRYHPLLIKHQTDTEDLTPLPYIMKLIQHPKCSDKVIDATFSLIEKLLQLNDGRCSEEDLAISAAAVPLKISPILDVESCGVEKGIENLSLGEYIVFQHMDTILTVMKHRLSKHSLSKRDLAILIKLVGWIRSQEMCEDLINLIVPLLSKNLVKDQEKVTYLLDTCSNLISANESPERYMKDFLKMLCLYNESNQRNALCNVIEAISEKIPIYFDLAKWCKELNSWDPKMLNEMDFNMRLQCYKTINTYLETTQNIQEEAGIALISQNMWSIIHIEDSAIRDASISCLQNFAKMVSRLHSSNPTLARNLIEHSLLLHIKHGLKNNKEKVRDDAMNLLGTLVIHCNSFVPRLKDLFKLSDLKESENDFFINMCHIQRHRRARALNKLSEKLRTNNISLQKETLVEFLLPLTTSFLFKDEYAKDDYLITSAVSCLGALAKQLQWHQYQNLLKYYLNLMAKDIKQLRLGVRVLEAIIDAFHERVTDNDTSEKEKENSSGNITAEEIDNESNTAVKGRRVYFALTTTIIPKIQQTLASRSIRDTEHKVNKKKYPEDEDIKRIPLSLALIKLLKKLPRKALASNVNNVFMKLITFLTSRAESIRQEARNMLVKVMSELGGEYFSHLVQDMNIILARGFQAHVFVFTLHAIMIEMQTSIKPGHIDNCLQEIVELCIKDIVGEQAQEKGVVQITSKYKEVKAERGLAILGIVSSVISVSHLEELISPLKELLQTYDKRIVDKVSTCLQKIANGLDRNSNINVEQKAIFLYRILKKEMTQMEETKSMAKTNVKTNLIQPADSYVLLPEPKKSSMKPKTSLKNTSYIFTEFALKLLHILLRHGYFQTKCNEHCSLLDPYVSIMKNGLHAEHPELSHHSLLIISWLIKYPLPSLKEHLRGICGQMFVILNKYSMSSLLKGKIYDMVQLVFKTLSTIIRDVPEYSIEKDHVSVLIHYARENLEDYSLHHSTFTILQALIHRKINVPELHDVMKSVQELSIIATNTNMLDQARSCYFKYLTNYPKNKKQYVSALYCYLGNISYAVPKGQLSVLLMINDILSKYPRNLIDKACEKLLWYKIAEEYTKTELKEHKELLHKALKTLYTQSKRKRMLIDMCIERFENNNTDRCESAFLDQMGAAALGAFLDAHPNVHPPAMLSTVASKVVQLLDPSRFETYSREDNHLADEREIVFLDASLNSLLETFSKLVNVYMTRKNLSNWSKCIDDSIWDHIKSHLLYPNLQVRLLACTIVGRHFTLFPTERKEIAYLTSTPEKARSLVLDFCDQLSTKAPIDTPSLNQLSLAVVRNLVYMIRLSDKISLKSFRTKLTDDCEDNVESSDEEQEDSNVVKESSEDSNTSTPRNSIYHGAIWVLSRVRRLAYKELRFEAKASTMCRESFLNLIAGVVVVFNAQFSQHPGLISLVVSHIVRELADEHLPESLVKRTKELDSLVKEYLGADRHRDESVKAQVRLSKKKNERRARERENVIANPQVALKRREKKIAANKVSKKRKHTEGKFRQNKKVAL